MVEARNLDLPPDTPLNGAPKGSKPKKAPLKFQIFRFVVVVGFVAIAAVMYLKRKQGCECLIYFFFYQQFDVLT